MKNTGNDALHDVPVLINHHEDRVLATRTWMWSNNIYSHFKCALGRAIVKGLPFATLISIYCCRLYWRHRFAETIVTSIVWKGSIALMAPLPMNIRLSMFPPKPLDGVLHDIGLHRKNLQDRNAVFGKNTHLPNTMCFSLAPWVRFHRFHYCFH